MFGNYRFFFFNFAIIILIKWNFGWGRRAVSKSNSRGYICLYVTFHEKKNNNKKTIKILFKIFLDEISIYPSPAVDHKVTRT